MGGRPHRILFFWHSSGNKFLTFISNMFTNLNLTDMETCYKMFNADMLKSLKLKEKRFGFEPEVTAKVSRKERDRMLVTDVFLSLRLPLLRIHVREIEQIETLMHKLTTAWMERLEALNNMPLPEPESPQKPATEPLETVMHTQRLIQPTASLQLS